MHSRPLAALRALGALAAIAVLVAGVPFALLTVGVLPSWDQVRSALSGPDDGSLFLGALTLLGWAAWAFFTLAFLVEAVAALRHRSAPRVPLLGVTQHLAASLVAAIVVLLPATSAIASSAPAHAAALHLPHAAQRSPDTAMAEAVATAGTITPAIGGAFHTVTSRDETLWGIAAGYLGDGRQWRSIVELNRDVIQPDGSRITAATTELQPGWTLRLPAGARSRQLAHDGTHARPAATPASTEADSGAHGNANPEQVHLVKPGDTLSEIAEEDLGYADAYPQIVAANQHTEQRDGRHLSNPDLIYPGWKLTIPQHGSAPADTSDAGNATGSSSPTAAAGSTPSAPHPDGPVGSATGPSTQAGPTSRAAAGDSPVIGAPGESGRAAQPTRQTPGTSPASAAASPDASASPQAAGPATTPSVTTTPPSSTAPAVSSPTPTPVMHASASSGSELRTGAGIALLLATGLMTGYGVKRSLQQRRRRPGQTIALPEQTSHLEQVLAHQADQPTTELLDQALRTLAARLPEGEPLPLVEAARITSTGIHVRADGPASPPFLPSDGEGWWALDRSAELIDENLSRKIPAPYPALASIGTEPDKTLLLGNLTSSRVLLLDGPPQPVREVARSLTIEAAATPWGTDLQILCAGVVEPDLPALLHTGRVQHLERPGHAVADLAELLLTDHQEPGQAVPWMLIVADTISEDDAWQLADLVARAPDAPIALVLPATGLEALFPDAVHLDCADTDPQPTALGPVPVRLQRLTEAAYQTLAADLRTTEEPATEPAGPWTQVPADVEPSDLDTQEHPSADHAEDPEPRVITPFLAFSQRQGPTGPTTVPPLPGAHPTAAQPDPETEPEKPEEAAVPTSGRADVTHRDAAPTAPAALQMPEIRILGPVDLSTLGSGGRGRRLAELAAYLYLYPHRSTSDIAEAMNPVEPWDLRTVTTRISEVRRHLGTSLDGAPRLARVTKGNAFPPLNDVGCDWTRFLALAERGLTAGPAGVADLEAALLLVRGRPFASSTASWAMPVQQHMISRIIDTAHTVARYQTDAGRWDAARAAVVKGLEVEPAAELLFRDWITLEARSGNRGELHRVTSRLQRELRALDVDMDHDTERLLQAVYERDLQGA